MTPTFKLKRPQLKKKYQARAAPGRAPGRAPPAAFFKVQPGRAFGRARPLPRLRVSRGARMRAHASCRASGCRLGAFAAVCLG
jgi:hypothetical protein